MKGWGILDNKLRAIIVDDEAPAREELKFLIKESFSKEIEIIGEADNGIDAIEKIKSFKPEIIFLDIKMPGLNGIEVAQISLDHNPELNIVFITAFDEYALKAFEINAIDYLVKPISFARLKKTILRLMNKQNSLTSHTNNIEKVISELKNLIPHQTEKNLPCEEYGKIILIKREDIFYCTVENGITYIGIKDKKIKTFYTLKELENKLDFFRAHRSYIVNLDYVKHVEPLFHGSYSLVLNDKSNTEIPVSRINSKKLRELLEL